MPSPSARDHDPVQLRPVDVLLQDRLAGRRRDERLVKMAVDVVERLDAKHAALPAAVHRLQHRREARPRRPPAASPTASAPPRTAAAARPPPRAAAASRSCASSGARSRRRCPGGRAPRRPRRRPAPRGRPHTVSTPSIRKPRGRLQHGPDVGEVDDLRDVRLRQPRRVRIPVDGRDAKAQLLRPENRAALVAACTDEENGPHGRRILLRRERGPE